MFKVNISGLEESFKRALSDVLREDGCGIQYEHGKGGYKNHSQSGF